jgi:hypothetical protein
MSGCPHSFAFRRGVIAECPYCDERNSSFAAPAGSAFMSPEEYGRYWHDLAQERVADNMRLRDALVAARKQILERNGLDRDSDRLAAIAINRALSSNKS